MIRWYDYVAAFIAADFIMTGAIIFFTVEEALVSFAGGLSMLVMYDGWNTYCEWRKNRERL